MSFPEINYRIPAPILGVDGVLPKGPRRMITLLTNRGILQPGEMAAIHDMQQLEQDILARIKAYQPGDAPLPIFHRIQIWGGSTGRNIYTRNGGFCSENVIPHYLTLINGCNHIVDLNPESLNAAFDIIHVFNANVRNIGVSFITKHTRFWLSKTLGENALPIYDTVMANNIMEQNKAKEQDIVPYWNQMIAQAEDEGISLVALERILFHYFN